jgi:subfamily B ATP-binding cassette protein MsbA
LRGRKQRAQGDGASALYLLRRLAREHLLPYKGGFALAFLCMAVISATTGLQAYLIEPIVDDVFVNRDKSRLFLIAGAVLAVSVVKGICGYGHRYVMAYLGQSVTVDIQKRLYRHLILHDYAFIVGESSGRRVSRFTNDVFVLRASVSSVLTGAVKEYLTLLALVSVMFYQSWQLSLVAFGAFPLAVYPVMALGRRMRKVAHRTQEAFGAYTERLAETLHNIVAIQSCRRERYEIDKAGAALGLLLSHYKKAARIQALSSPLMEILSGAAVAGVICYGGIWVMEGGITSGKFTSFLSAVVMAYKPAKSLSGMNAALQEGLAAARRLFSVLDVPPALARPANPVPVPPADRPYVELENVGFRYGAGEPVLQGVSLVFRHGETVALVGASGGGKSTLLHLLMRLYDPTEGRILASGVDIRDVALEEWRGRVAYASQQVLLFDASVAENIAYACPDADRDAVVRAAEDAAADGFIRALPNGYGTIVGENGHTLSGGQRQRLAVARALLQHAPLLLLDEATSALDTLSERHILDSLKRSAGERATIIAAHRLSTVKDADRIVVMENGRVAEEGTHDELMRKGGTYAGLYRGGYFREGG